MSDMTREVYKDEMGIMPELNPFVEMPRMRASTLNRINDLIRKAEPKPMKKYEFSDGTFNSKCPICNELILPKKHNYCPKCGQRIDTENYEL